MGCPHGSEAGALTLEPSPSLPPDTAPSPFYLAYHARPQPSPAPRGGQFRWREKPYTLIPNHMAGGVRGCRGSVPENFVPAGMAGAGFLGGGGASKRGADGCRQTGRRRGRSGCVRAKKWERRRARDGRAWYLQAPCRRQCGTIQGL